MRWIDGDRSEKRVYVAAIIIAKIIVCGAVEFVEVPHMNPLVSQRRK